MRRMPSRPGRFAVWLVCLAPMLGTGCRGRVPSDAVAAWDGGFITRAEAERYFASLETRGLRTGSQVNARSGVTQILSDLAFLKIAAAEAGDSATESSILYLDAKAASLVHYYVERKGKRPQEIPDDEVRAYYEEHLADRFTLPESCTFRHVFLRADRHSKEELARLERTVLDSLARGTAFSMAANTYSESGSARRGGTVGPVFRGRLDAAFEKQLYLLKPGKPAVFHVQLGTHIVEVLERRPSRVLPFEEVRQQVVLVIMDRRNENERDQLMATLRTRYGVVDRSDDPTVGPDDVVVSVKGRDLTRKQLEAYLARRGGRFGPGGKDAKLRRRWVDDLIRSNLLYLDALESGMERERAFTDRWEIRRLTLRSKVAIERRFRAEAKKVADDEVLRYYRENQGRFAVSQRFQASYLFLPFGSAPPFELEQRLEALEKLAVTPGVDPAEVAHRCEEAGAVYVDMDWATPEDAAQVAPEFQRRLLAQTAPGSTGVFQEEEGLFVILVRAVEARRPMTEPADHEAIRALCVELRKTDILREIKERELEERGFRVLSTDIFKSADAKS